MNMGIYETVRQTYGDLWKSKGNRQTIPKVQSFSLYYWTGYSCNLNAKEKNHITRTIFKN